MIKTVLILALTLTLASTAPSKARISVKVLQALKNEGSLDVIVSLKAKTGRVIEKIQSQSFYSRGAKITSMASALQAYSASTQKPILKFLASQGKTVKSFWITNQIFVKDATMELVLALATMETVDSIADNRKQMAPLEEATPTPANREEIQWGVEMVEAPAAWDLGFTGRGVVVGILDTGVRGTHETLRDNYRPLRGWLDMVDRSEFPVDSRGHGTHVMGSIVGRGGIGVAPEATWIACRANMNFAYVDYLECGEFFLCPTHPNGTEPNCYAAPNIVSHSWRFFYDTEEDFLDETILAWKAAGIITVWANGNEGSMCSSSGYPPYTNLPLIAVGASDSNDNLAYFSSRGPGKWSGEGRIRPDITAPGVDVVSADSYSDTGLATMSGTSMAAPHAAGVIALLLTNGTELPFEDVTRLIFESATHTIPSTNGNCGGIDETDYPNNAVGHGRINALGAVTRYLESRNK